MLGAMNQSPDLPPQPAEYYRRKAARKIWFLPVVPGSGDVPVGEQKQSRRRLPARAVVLQLWQISCLRPFYSHPDNSNPLLGQEAAPCP